MSQSPVAVRTQAPRVWSYRQEERLKVFMEAQEPSSFPILDHPLQSLWKTGGLPSVEAKPDCRRGGLGHEMRTDRNA